MENIGGDLSLPLISSVVSDILISLLSLSQDKGLRIKDLSQYILFCCCRCSPFTERDRTQGPASGYFRLFQLEHAGDDMR